MRSEQTLEFKFMFLQLIVVSIKIYRPTVTATSILSFTACYSELLDLSTMLVASTYKSKATDTPEENQTAIPPVTCVTSSTPLFCGCHRTKSRFVILWQTFQEKFYYTN